MNADRWRDKCSSDLFQWRDAICWQASVDKFVKTACAHALNVDVRYEMYLKDKHTDTDEDKGRQTDRQEGRQAQMQTGRRTNTDG